jgi:hypothetical protein
VLERFRHPGHVGPITGKAVREGVAGSRRQGTLVKFQVAVKAGRIADAGFRVFGSPYAIAACSLAAETIIGRAAGREAIPPGRELAEALQFPVEETGIALIVEDAIHAALNP